MDLNQITLAVRDLDEGIAFYRALGLRLIVHSPDTAYARFELPSGATTLSLHEDPAARPGATALYFEVEDVDRRHADLTAIGIPFDSPLTDEIWRLREAWFADPSGNRLCLFHAGADRRFPPWRIESGPDQVHPTRRRT